MMTKEEYKNLILKRIKGFEIYNRWEEQHNFPEQSKNEILESIWNLYDNLPEELKQVKIDLNRDGIVKMHQALSVLDKKNE